jgi:hypothetical protein
MSIMTRLPFWFHIPTWRCLLASDLALVGTIFLLVSLAYLSSDKINVNEGFGWDGRLYGRWAQDFVPRVFGNRPDYFGVQRIFPSGLVYAGLRLLSVERTNANVILGFVCLNLASVTIAAYVWCRIARLLGISTAGKWLGAIFFFVNFAVLKQMSYYPVLTDMVAFGIAMIMLHCYLTSNPLALSVAVVCGAFTWPPIIYAGIGLLLFPRTGPTQLSRSSRHVAGQIVAAISTGALIVMLALLAMSGHRAGMGKSDPQAPALYVAAAAAAAYLYYGLKHILSTPTVLSLKLPRALSRNGLLIAVVLTVGVTAIQGYLSRDRSSHALILLNLQNVPWTSVIQPGLSYVAHFLYFGPWFALAVFLWKPVCRLIHQEGAGLTLAVALGVVLSLGSESRQSTSFVPLVVPFVVKATDALGWGPGRYCLLAGLSLVFSKIWLTIGPVDDNPQAFPLQGYYLSHGPWIREDMYLIQGFAVLLTSAALWAFWVRGRNGAPTPTQVLSAR